MRQIPYTIMKFTMFERTAEFLWKSVWPRPREVCGKGEQLCVTFIAGYIGARARCRRSYHSVEMHEYSLVQVISTHLCVHLCI